MKWSWLASLTDWVTEWLTGLILIDWNKLAIRKYRIDWYWEVQSVLISLSRDSKWMMINLISTNLKIPFQFLFVEYLANALTTRSKSSGSNKPSVILSIRMFECGEIVIAWVRYFRSGSAFKEISKRQVLSMKSLIESYKRISRTSKSRITRFTQRSTRSSHSFQRT